MKRRIARILRAAARRLDPPEPRVITLNLQPILEREVAALADAVSWAMRTGGSH